MMFLIPAAGVPNEYMLQDTLKSAIAAFGILLAGLTLLWDLHTHPRPVCWHWILFLPGSLCLYALGSMAWSHAYLAGVEAVRWGLLCLLLFICLNSLERSGGRRVLWGLHWGAVAAATWVCLQFWLDLQWFPQVAPPASTFANRNFYAEYAVTALPFSFALIYTEKNIHKSAAIGLTTVLPVTALMMAGTRSALLTLVVVLVLISMTLMHLARHTGPGHWKKVRLLVPALALFMGCGILANIPRSSSHTMSQGDSVTPLGFAFTRAQSLTQAQEYSHGSFATRAFYWRSTMRMMQQHPWFGVGAGAWEVEIPQYEGINNSVEADYYAHNDILQLLSEYGLIVGLLWIAFFGAYILQTWRSMVQVHTARESNHFQFRCAAATAAIAAILVSGAGFPLHLAGVGVLLTVTLAWLAKTQPSHAEMFGQTLRSCNIRPALLLPLTVLGAISLAACMLASILAYRSESNLMRAVNWANRTIMAQTTPTSAELGQLVKWIDNGLEINPHQRKLASPAVDALVAFGDYENAARILDVLATSRPHVADIWANLVLIRSNFGDYKRAEIALSQLERLQPIHSRTQRLKVLLLYRQGQATQAKEQLLTFLNAKDAAFELFNFAYSMGIEIHDETLAIAAISLRTVRWPDTAVDGFFKIGMLYANAQMPDNNRALEAFRQGLERVSQAEHPIYLNAIPEPFRSQLH